MNEGIYICVCMCGGVCVFLLARADHRLMIVCPMCIVVAHGGVVIATVWVTDVQPPLNRDLDRSGHMATVPEGLLTSAFQTKVDLLEAELIRTQRYVETLERGREFPNTSKRSAGMRTFRHLFPSPSSVPSTCSPVRSSVSWVTIPGETVEPLLFYDEVRRIKEENRSLRDLLEEKEVANEVIRKKLMQSMARTDELQLVIDRGLRDSDAVSPVCGCVHILPRPCSLHTTWE